MTTNPAACTSINNAVRPKVRSRQGRVAWSEVLGAVQSNETRSLFLSRYRSSEFTPDQFNQPLVAARQACADALVATEDGLESVRGSRAETERTAIHTVRRRLEVELWP